MDFVNKAYAQLAELFRSMSPGTRIAVGLLLAVIVVSLVYLFQYQAVGGDEFLLDGRPFSASEMTAIEAAFAQGGLGKSTIVGNRIRIPRGQKEVYLAALADNSALPADFYKYMDEATASDNPFASTRSLELKRLNAKQKELALIISRMRGIASATVQYDEEIKHGLTRTKSKVAMVAVQTTSGSIDPDQVKAIRNIVASAYAGLDRQSITITDMTSNLSYGGSAGPDGMPDDESLYASHKQKYERDWQRKIADQLSMIPGVVVGVNVELSPELQNTSQTVKIDPKPVTVSSSEFTKEASQQPASGGGRPGAVPNGVVGNQPVAISTASQGPQSETNETRSQVQNVPGHEQRVIETAALVPTKVTAAIDVPASYFMKIWRERNPAPAGQAAKTPDPTELAKIETETKDKIKSSVRNLLPSFAVGTDPYPHITVETYTDLPAAPLSPPSVAGQASMWLADNWRTVGMIGIGGFCLLMLRSMVRSTKSEPKPVPASANYTPTHASNADTDTPEEFEEPTIALKRRFGSSGPDLKAELRELVRENPDTAANILRSWIGDAA